VSFTEQLPKLTVFLHRENFGRKEAVTTKTEMLVYVLPVILCIGAVEKLCSILYTAQVKPALIWLKAQIATHSVMLWYCHYVKDTVFF